MEYTEKVAWLRRYRESLRQEQLLGEEIGQLESQARRVTRAISGMPGGGGDGQAIPRALERLEETPGCWNRIRPSGPRSPPPSKRRSSPCAGTSSPGGTSWDSGGRRSPPPITWCCGRCSGCITRRWTGWTCKMSLNVTFRAWYSVPVKAAGGETIPAGGFFFGCHGPPENTPRPEAGKSPGSGPAEGQAPTTDRGPFSCGQPDAKGRLSAMAMADALKKFTASARSMPL